MRLRRSRALALAALAVATGACRGEAPTRAAATRTEPVKVRVVALERSSGSQAALAPGAVYARQRAVLAARVPAAVVELPYREGERVAKGAVVARLDAAALESAVTAAEAAARAAEADQHRVEGLLARGAATPKEAEEAASRAAGAAAAVAMARDALAYAVLRAPFAGTLAARPVHVGDVVAPGAPVVEVEGSEGFEVRCTVDERIAAAAQPGLEISALVDGQPAALAATLRSVSPAGDPSTHRFDVRADLAPAAGLRSGLFARLAFPSRPAEGHLRVPEGAVVRRGGLSGVFVLVGGRAQLRWIALGETADGLTEVRAGAEAGERVAADPAGLADGTAVVEVP